MHPSPVFAMIRFLFLILIPLTLTQTGCMQKNSPTSLKENVDGVLSIDSAVFGIAYKDLVTGETYFHNEKHTFHAASTMKTPVLIELFRQAKDGKFSMKDSIPVKNSFQSIADGSTYTLDPADDSEFELYQKTGSSYPIDSLAHEMITRSSNLATNLLIELTGAANIMKTMQSIGANDIRILRGVEDNKAFAKGLNNMTTAYDLMLLFEKMAMLQLVDSASSAAMIEILLHQEFKEIIPARLPSNVRVAHKTGSIRGIQHDSGIVFLPGGKKYVLVLLSSFPPQDEKKVIEAMANVSRVFYEHASQTAD
jgi:beta-lactamase class A